MTITSSDILDLNVAVRADRFAFTLLDATHTTIGTLDVADSSPTVSVDTTRNATRSLTNVTIAAADLSNIDPIHHRVQPAMILQNGERFPLGIYMFGQDNRTPYSWGTTMTPELVDETFIVDRALDTTATLATGGSIVGLITALLAPIAMPGGVIIEAADQPSGSPLVYRVGSGRYAALAALSGLLGCYPPFFDNAGAFRFKIATPPGDVTIDHIFASGGRTITGSTTVANTAYRAPNRYQVIGDNVTAPVVGSYDLPAAAPNSATQKGYVVTTSQNMQGLSDQGIADLAAYVAALTDRSTYSTITFSSTADPRHGTYDTMLARDVRYLETGWSLQMSAGGPMTHQGTVLWG